MPQAVIATTAAIDNLMSALRRRLEAALQNGQRVSCFAREGMKRDSFTEPDGSFDFNMTIEAKRSTWT